MIKKQAPRNKTFTIRTQSVLIDEARSLGINLSQTLHECLVRVVKLAKQKAKSAENDLKLS